MTREIQDKIFDPFFTTKFAGRGLGLAAVQGIVRSPSRLDPPGKRTGAGTRFEILLPCAQEAAKLPRRNSASRNRPLGPPRPSTEPCWWWMTRKCSVSPSARCFAKNATP